MIDSESQKALEAVRKFLRPTIRGKVRALSRKLFPLKPCRLGIEPGDMVNVNGRELEVRRTRGRFVEFTDGSEMVIGA